MDTKRLLLLGFTIALLVAGCSKAFFERKFEIASHELEVELFPETHTLKAKDKLELTFKEKSNAIFLFLNKNLKIDSIKAAGNKLSFETVTEFDISRYEKRLTEERKTAYRNAQLLNINIPESALELELEVFYNGEIYDSLKVPTFSRDYIADQTTGFISLEGTYLSHESFWYPTVPNSLSAFRITVSTPSEYEVVTEGRLIQRQRRGNKRITVWEQVNLIDAMHLIAGKYTISRLQYRGINIYTYLFPESQKLSNRYLEASAKYLKMYERLLGEYPYSKFAVVENFFPSGYGMPSYTLLGSTVIRLPFIISTSLGHEVCHNWWGNGIYVHPESGNWCEGLTTYCADYYYKELKGEEWAREYRVELNKNYTVYVNVENDFPLEEFESRTTPASRAIGYGKSAMVFHQLRRMIGDDQFYQALKLFFKRKVFQWAGWSDIQTIFEEVSGQDLEWYFEQWIRKPGAPQFYLGEVTLSEQAGKYMVTADITCEPRPGKQKKSRFRVFLPIVVETENRRIEKVIEVDSVKERVTFNLDARPLSLKVDPDHHVFRRLNLREIPPSLSMIFAEKQPLFLLPSKAKEKTLEAYKTVAERLDRNKTAQIKTDDSITEKELQSYTVVIFGGKAENKLFEKFRDSIPEDLKITDKAFTLFGKSYFRKDDCLVATFRNPFNPQKSVLLFWGLSPDAIQSVGTRIAHYGKYSYLIFKKGRNIVSGVWPVSDNPLVFEFKYDQGTTK